MKNTRRDPEEKRRLLGVLDAEWGTIGPRFAEASEAAAKAAKVAFGLCVCSASAALEVILRAFNIGRGDEVIVAAWSDRFDSLTCASVGAVPAVADVDEKTLTLTPDTAAKALSDRSPIFPAAIPATPPLCLISAVRAG